MKGFSRLLFILILASFALAEKNPKIHDWQIGRILDEQHARYYAGTIKNSWSSTNESGSVNATATTNTFGHYSSTNVDGSYSGVSNTSSSGYSVPIYRVYENLMIEGADTVYVTSERIRWRWSKSAHVAVNGDVKYFVEGRKLHILDLDGKEHTVSILKEIRREPEPAPLRQYKAPTPPVESPVAPPEPSFVPNTAPRAAMGSSQSAWNAEVSVSSNPPYAEINIDGKFVGNTPSIILLTPGDHIVHMRKPGYMPYYQSLHVSSGKLSLNADLIPLP